MIEQIYLSTKNINNTDFFKFFVKKYTNDFKFTCWSKFSVGKTISQGIDTIQILKINNDSEIYIPFDVILEILKKSMLKCGWKKRGKDKLIRIHKEPYDHDYIAQSEFERRLLLFIKYKR